MFGKKKNNGSSQAGRRDDPEETLSAMLQKIHSDAAKVDTSGSMTSAIKECFDRNDWKYDYDSEKDCFLIRFTGENMRIRILLAPLDGALMSFTEADMNPTPDAYQKITWKLNELNRNIRYGSFFLDDDDGRILFRCGNVFPDNNPSPDFIDKFVGMLIDTVDKSGLKEVVEVPKGKTDSNPMFN